MFMPGGPEEIGVGDGGWRLLHAEANRKAWEMSSRRRRASRRASGRRTALLVVEDAGAPRAARKPREDGVSNTDRVDCK